MKKLLIIFLLLDGLISIGQTNEIDLQAHLNRINEFESKFDTLNNDYLISLNNLGKLYEKTKQIKLAEDIYLKTLKIRISKFGILHLDVATSSIHLSDFYYNLGQYDKAIKFSLKAVEIRSKLLQENDILYIKSLGKLAAVYLGLKNYNDAEKYFLKGLKLKQEYYKDDDQTIILSLENLINLYNKQGKYSSAEEFYLILNQLYKKTKGENDFDYINSLSNLAVVYYYQEKYLDAEIAYINTIEALKQNTNNDSKFIRRYIESMSNLAELYRKQEKFTKSEEIFKQALGVNKLKLNDNVDMQIVLKHNLALLYKDINNYVSSSEYLIETLELIKKNYGRENLQYASTIGNLGTLFTYLGYNKKTILPLLNSQLLIRKKILGTNHPLYLESLIKLAEYYRNLRKFNKSREKYLEALIIVKNNYEENNQQIINVLIKLSEISRLSHKNEAAYNYLNEYLIKNQFRLKEIKTSFVENELQFYGISNESSKDEMLNFVHDFPAKYPNLNINSFNNLILLKHLSLKNRELINQSIQKNSTTLIKNKYLEFLENKKQIEKYNGLPIQDQNLEYEKLKIETSKLEKELVKESSKFSKIINENSISFTDLTKNLKNNEVILDLNLFKYNKKKGINQNLYASFVVKKDFEFPKFVQLFEEKELTRLIETNKIQLDSTKINKKYQEQAISELFLKPLKEELKDINTIYISPSGLSHQINFAALPIEGNQLLGEKYKVHIISSPAEIVDFKAAKLEQKTNLELLLYGGINYDKTNASTKDTLKTQQTCEIIDLQTRSGINSFGYLMGSQKEVSAIQLKGTKNGFKTSILEDRNATEESIKKLDGRASPFVLHLATHGFFFPDPVKENELDKFGFEGKAKIYKASDDPMMRSGLLFSGANKYWGKANENISSEDGILTASEISNLNLSACQLVVLSACETGLGEIKGSEGVFGLQRAFKMAGVKNIIMSLWKVPDTQTAELFEIFYEECFAGKTIHEAFQSAQAKMKLKYSPYYWAGFVLLE